MPVAFFLLHLIPLDHLAATQKDYNVCLFQPRLSVPVSFLSFLFPFPILRSCVRAVSIYHCFFLCGCTSDTQTCIAAAGVAAATADCRFCRSAHVSFLPTPFFYPFTLCVNMASCNRLYGIRLLVIGIHSKLCIRDIIHFYMPF